MTLQETSHERIGWKEALKQDRSEYDMKIDLLVMIALLRKIQTTARRKFYI